jgi:soluble lytic murein transglycosylase-like protein
MRRLIAIRTRCTTLIARATTRRAVAGTLSTALLFALLLATNPTSSDAKVAEHVAVPDLILELRNAKPLPAPSHADSVAAERELPDEVLHARLEAYFRRFTTDARMAGRVSRAVVRYARAHDVPPSLVAAVLVTENRTLKPRASSSVGARGLMQVMPFHAGMKGCPSSDLVNVENNICHGTRILRDVLDRAQTTRGALLRYNGCVAGTNTPDCWKYPRMVLTRAGRVRRHVLADTQAFAPEAPPLARLVAVAR